MSNCTVYLFVISFFYKSESGLALVGAYDQNAAWAMLKNGGKFNGNPDGYVLESIRNIGASTHDCYEVLFETYTNAKVAFDAIRVALERFHKESEILPYDDAPIVDGSAAAGLSDKYARGDHRHPSDPSKQDAIGDLETIRRNAASALTAYRKPNNGIPASDLAQSVQQALTKANTAIQEHQDISGKQDVISDLSAIRSGASAGSTAVQPSALNDYVTDSELSSAVSAKQDALVSGTNIKTINNESILGSGNITIEGGGSVENLKTIAGQSLEGNGDVVKSYDIAGRYLCTSASSRFTAVLMRSNGGLVAVFWNNTEGGGAIAYNNYNVSLKKNSEYIGIAPNNAGNYRLLILYAQEELVFETLKTLSNANDLPVTVYYSKPSTGIPATDLASGVIPDVSGFYTKPAGGIPMSDLASAVKKGVGSFYSVEAQGTLSTQDPLDIANDIDSGYNVYIVGTIASDIYDTIMDYGGGAATPLHITQYEYDSGVYYFCGVISSEGGDVYSFVISMDESTGNADYTTTKFAKDSDIPTVQSLTNAEIDTIWSNAS